MSTDVNTALQSVDQLTKDFTASILNRCRQYRLAMVQVMNNETLQDDNPESRDALSYSLLNTSCIDLIEAAAHHLARVNTLTVQESLKP